MVDHPLLVPSILDYADHMSPLPSFRSPCLLVRTQGPKCNRENMLQEKGKAHLGVRNPAVGQSPTSIIEELTTSHLQFFDVMRGS
jgi:hypothetical protein